MDTEAIKTYVRSKYQRMYGEKLLIITQHDTHIQVKSNIDESPLILSKNILND
tara:strand:- start:2393 stop:2551 length:159 start_codon:yes stop_codon:yes gene_type:complete